VCELRHVHDVRHLRTDVDEGARLYISPGNVSAEGGNDLRIRQLFFCVFQLNSRDAFYPGNFALKLKKALPLRSKKFFNISTVKVFRFRRN
jgi:hypothetical protein